MSLLNLFNRAQFHNRDGEINSGTFGLVTGARDPRIMIMQVGIMQGGAKFLF